MSFNRKHGEKKNWNRSRKKIVEWTFKMGMIPRICILMTKKFIRCFTNEKKKKTTERTLNEKLNFPYERTNGRKKNIIIEVVGRLMFWISYEFPMNICLRNDEWTHSSKQKNEEKYVEQNLMKNSKEKKNLGKRKQRKEQKIIYWCRWSCSITWKIHFVGRNIVCEKIFMHSAASAKCL